MSVDPTVPNSAPAEEPKPVVTQQPNPDGQQPPPAGWGTSPTPGPTYQTSCPPGLQYLTTIDQLLIKQSVELLEVFTGFETNNKYKILNSLGQSVFFAAEDTCCLFRICCGKRRPFDIKVLDNLKTEVIHLDRPLRCDFCFWFCCLQKLQVEAPPGTHIGSVHQTCHICNLPRYDVKDASGETVLKIKGPLCACNFCSDIEFEIFNKDGITSVGKISKDGSGLAKEIFTDADNFGISFPLEMDVLTKATLLGAVFLIDIMYFENPRPDNLNPY